MRPDDPYLCQCVCVCVSVCGLACVFAWVLLHPRTLVCVRVSDLHLQIYVCVYVIFSSICH